MDSMYSNQVWELEEPGNAIRPIGCKWVYKRKRGVDAKVETFKRDSNCERIYSERRERLSEDFFACMLKYTRILLAIAAYFDYEIWQIDVNTTLLNESLECIYMIQPEGFTLKDQENLLCKLKKSIYECNQSV